MASPIFISKTVVVNFTKQHLSVFSLKHSPSFCEGETLKRAFNARLDIPKEASAGHALPPPPPDIGQHLNGTFKLNYHHITFYRQPYPGTFLPLNGLFLMHL